MAKKKKNKSLIKEYFEWGLGPHLGIFLLLAGFNSIVLHFFEDINLSINLSLIIIAPILIISLNSLALFIIKIFKVSANENPKKIKIEDYVVAAIIIGILYFIINYFR